MADPSASQSSLPIAVVRSLWGGAVFCAIQFWKWPVLSTVALFIGAVGVSAMYGDQYIVAACAYFICVTLLTARTVAESRTREEKAGVTLFIVAVGALVLGASLWLVKHTYEGKTKNQTNLVSAASAWVWQSLASILGQVSWRWVFPSAVVGFVFAALIHALQERQRKTLSVRIGSADRQEVGVLDNLDRYLREIAKKDKTSINSLVRITGIYYDPQFEKGHINFTFAVFNNSIYDIVLNIVIKKGDVRFGLDNEEFHYDLRIDTKELIHCTSRRSNFFVLRQALTEREIIRFREAENMLIGFGHLDISFQGTEQFPEIQPTSLDTNYYLETKKRMWRASDEGEFAFVFTDEQWAELTAKRVRTETENESLRTEVERLTAQLAESIRGSGSTLAEVPSAHADRTQPERSQQSNDQFRFAVDRDTTLRVTVNRRHFWISLGFLDSGSFENGWAPKDFPVRIYTAPNDRKPRIDTKVYSAELGLVEIKNNHLAVKPKGWDQNSNNRAIEIVNEHGIPVFQAVLSAANQLDIEAVFSEAESKSGWRMEALFKYPSNDHFGEFARDFGLLPLDAKSLYQLFLIGCGDNGVSHGGYRLKHTEAHQFPIDYVICTDSNSKATYFNIFITKDCDAAQLLKLFAAEYQDFLRPHLRAGWFVRMNPGEPPERVTDSVFTGVIGIYHEGPLMPEQPEEIRQEFAKHGASVRFYGPDYVIIKNSPLYDRALGRFRSC